MSQTAAQRGYTASGSRRNTRVRQWPAGPVIAKVHAPNGETFTIATVRSRVLRRNYVGLRLRFSSGRVIESAALRVMPALYWNVGRVCGSHPYGVMYGILHNSHDVASVRTVGHLEHLHPVPLKRGTPSPGAVVYKILTRTPGRLTVRVPTGRVYMEARVASIYAETPCAR